MALILRVPIVVTLKINLPLRAETIAALLNEAGFPSVEWVNDERWVVRARKMPAKSHGRAARQNSKSASATA
jgi:hypothetical protein